jgi:hypothetical protein
VKDARTAVGDVAGGVELRVVGAGDAVAEIHESARALDIAVSARRTAARHDGSGSGGGLSGRCPVVLKSTSLVMTPTPDGVTIVVTAGNAAEVDWLRRETRERLADLGGRRKK